MSRNRRNFTSEFKEEAVRAVIETSRPVAQVAAELGIHEATLGRWVNLYRREHSGDEPPLTVSERVRLREQEAELRELRQKVLFLEKVAAYFAKDPR